MSERTEAILSQMTLTEKIDMLAGADLWTTVPNERLNIPAMKVTDGPNGARGGEFGMGPTAACLPVGIAIGATWNTDLIEQLGGLLADEAKSKGANILLAPTINIHRSTLNGRNFECYSEDPWLAGRMATAYITGLQAGGIGACPKHFVANDSEFERYTMDSIVDERALREIYLAPFKAAVQEGGAWAVMSGYNKVNGVWCSENSYLLKDILKDEWGFDGIVMSDWFGTYSSQIGTGGLDLEMPGPSRYAASLLAEVNEGRLAESEIDDKVSRLLHTLERAGKFENPEMPEEFADDRPEHRAILRQAANEAIVLLKNDDDLLPLTSQKAQTIAIIGGNARWPGVMGGGSAIVPAHYIVTPLEGITARFGDQAELQYSIGAMSNKMLPALDKNLIKTSIGEQGVEIQFFDATDLSGDPVDTVTRDRMEMAFAGNINPNLKSGQNYSARITGTFTPNVSGEHQFSMVSAGLGRMKINGQTVIDNWDNYNPGVSLFDLEHAEKHHTLKANAGEPLQIEVEISSENAGMMNMVRFGYLPPLPADPIAEAVKAAQDADVAVIFVGTNHEWETEGNDQASMDLPGEQNALISAVAAVNPNTVVVLNTGTPKLLPWVDEVKSIVQMWFPGQEGGNAIADVLSGDVNPSGRLPQTFPKRYEDNPSWLNYPGENDEVKYGEGIFVGYRSYERRKIEPLFPFGHGLSYSAFEYANLKLSHDTLQAGDPLTVTVDVTNTGQAAGHEVVQLYVRDKVSRLVRPEQELKAFAKVMLNAGETKTVQLTLNEASFSYYDPAHRGWIAESGTFEIRVGRSSANILLTANVELVNPLDSPEFDKSGDLHVGLPIMTLMDNPASNAVLSKHIGDLMKAPTMLFNMTKPLEQFAAESPHLIDPRKLGRINQDLVTAK
ncbi:MAG: beta-glucosidase [Cellvibrionaceae bacterium]|jgi:beta-glucosidase